LAEGKPFKILKIKFDLELYDQLQEEARKHNIDVATYVRWCAQTGLYLEDLSAFVRTKRKEE
jgi:hypothetical protein